MQTLAQRHKARILAALAGGEGPAKAQAADRGPRAPAYEYEMLRLRGDQVRLKTLQSIERKIALKRELLPTYEAWIRGVLEGEQINGKGVQDEVLVTIMLWKIDVGDFAGAIPLAEYALRWNLTMPERFSRGLVVVLAEEIAVNSIRLLETGEAAPLTELRRVHELTQDSDMPDEVGAKLAKAIGLEFARRSIQPSAADAGVANAVRAYREAALEHLKRAYKLHERCGVKQDIARLEKLLGKDASVAVDAASATAAAAAAVAQVAPPPQAAPAKPKAPKPPTKAKAKPKANKPNATKPKVEPAAPPAPPAPAATETKAADVGGQSNDGSGAPA